MQDPNLVTEAVGRRDHERQLLRAAYVEESKRTERIVYAIGAVPLSALTLAETTWLPSATLTLALALAIIAYGLWYVNQYHANGWRIYEARGWAELIDPIGNFDQQAKNARESFNESELHSRLSGRTAKSLTFFLLLSAIMSLWSLFDQFIDLDFLPTLTQNEFAIFSVALLVPSVLYLCFELCIMFKEGSPS